MLLKINQSLSHIFGFYRYTELYKITLFRLHAIAISNDSHIESCSMLLSNKNLLTLIKGGGGGGG